MMYVAILACIAYFAFFAIGKIAEKRLRNALEYEKHSSDFYKYSKILIDNPDTPPTIIRLMMFMNRKMPKAHSGREFIFSVLFQEEEKPSLKGSYDEINEFFKTRPELEPSFERACKSAMYALSYRSFFFGFLIRRLFLFDSRDSHERPAQLVLQLNGRAKSHWRGTAIPNW